MKLLIVSSTCSKEKYKKIFEERNQKIIDPSQKFFDLLIDGMASHENVEIECLTGIPVSYSCHDRRFWGKEIEKLNKNRKNIYIGFINGKVMRHISLFINTLIETYMAINKSEKDNCIICDPLLLPCSLAALIVSKIKRVKIVALVTDIPAYVTVIGHTRMNTLRTFIQNIYDKITSIQIEVFSGYILLTEQMNEIINKNNKPYIVIEGSVDIESSKINNEIKNKSKTKHILYAGGIHEKFGVIKLVNAFKKTNLTNTELHIYGNGEAVPLIKETEKIDKRVKYKGVVSVEEIVKKEIEATLLINPRPTIEEFTKYSFPSKTLEYMVSGTPLLTTRLPGIPKEYFEYVYSIENESETEMSKKIEEILNINNEDLHRKGILAKQFVLGKKNNIIQGEEIIRFCKKLNI